MASPWWCRVAGQELGPVTFQDMVQMVRAGKLKEDDRVRRELSNEWIAARDVIGLFRAAQVPVAAPTAGDESTPVGVPRATEEPKPPPAAPPKPGSPVAGSSQAQPPGAAEATAAAAAVPPAEPKPDRLRRAAWVLAIAAAAALVLDRGYEWWTTGSIVPASFWSKVWPGRIREDFSSKRLDPDTWVVDLMRATVAPADGKLQVSVLPRRGENRPVGIRTRCRFEGDFEFRIDYAIVAIPKFETGEIKAEIAFDGRDGGASLTRAVLPNNQHSYFMWSHQATTFQRFPTEHQSGSLLLKRTGTNLSFQVAGPDGQFQELGAIPYGDGPLMECRVLVWGPALDAPFEWSFDNLEIVAGRITYPKKSFSKRFKGLWYPALLAVLVSTAAAVGVLWVRQRRRR